MPPAIRPSTKQDTPMPRHFDDEAAVVAGGVDVVVGGVGALVVGTGVGAAGVGTGVGTGGVGGGVGTGGVGGGVGGAGVGGTGASGGVGFGVGGGFGVGAGVGGATIVHTNVHNPKSRVNTGFEANVIVIEPGVNAVDDANGIKSLDPLV